MYTVDRQWVFLMFKPTVSTKHIVDLIPKMYLFGLWEKEMWLEKTHTQVQGVHGTTGNQTNETVNFIL